jgi:hypothetical protein
MTPAPTAVEINIPIIERKNLSKNRMLGTLAEKAQLG